MLPALDGGHVLDKTVVLPDESLDAREILADVFAAHEFRLFVYSLVQIVAIAVEGVMLQCRVQCFPEKATLQIRVLKIAAKTQRGSAPQKVRPEYGPVFDESILETGPF